MEVIGRGVQSVVVGGRLLAVMASAGRPLMLRDIAAGANVTPAQAHAYLVSFRKLDLVEQANESTSLARLRCSLASRVCAASMPCG
jgi:DNA-binding IclR family transcriptional regulator